MAYNEDSSNIYYLTWFMLFLNHLQAICLAKYLAKNTADDL